MELFPPPPSTAVQRQPIGVVGELEQRERPPPARGGDARHLVAADAPGGELGVEHGLVDGKAQPPAAEAGDRVRNGGALRYERVDAAVSQSARQPLEPV